MDLKTLQTLILISPFLNALIGGVIGQARGRTTAGLFFGFFLGPVGWILIWLGPDKNTMECPYCKERIKKNAIVCKYCRKAILLP